MFVANKVEEDALLRSWEELLGSKKLEELKKGKGFAFYRLIFSKIEEENFSVLYSDHILSSPNSPVNRLLGALIIQHQRNWSFLELESQLNFNIEIRVALGLKDFSSSPFSLRTLYNFKNRLHAYQTSTGIDLIKNLFDDLTATQLKELKIKTGIQRGDTVMLNSNIASYSRLSLLVEVLNRLYLSLSEDDQQLYAVWFSPYLMGGEKYAYEVKSQENASHLEQLATVYYGIARSLKQKYEAHSSFQIFERAYDDHFEEIQTEDSTVIQVRPVKELGCRTLQSPDDVDATYKKKREEKYRGYSALGVESCDPENEINLITHLNVHPNQTDDAATLAKDLDEMIKKTPDLKECHVDGGFGSTAVDIKAEEHQVNIIQTALKGAIAKVSMEVKGNAEIGFTVTCPNGEQPPVKAVALTKAYKASFDLSKCEQCPFKSDCPAWKNQVPKNGIAVFRFNQDFVLRQQRHKAILKIPQERRTLRSGVENLMGLMHRCEKHTGKLKITGLFNCRIYVFAIGIAINFERIYRHFDAIFQSLAPWHLSCEALTPFYLDQKVKTNYTHPYSSY